MIIIKDICDKFYGMSLIKLGYAIIINVLCKAIEIVKPDGYIDLGDVGEWFGCSHWQWKKKKRPPLEVQMPRIDQDVIDVNKGMDQIDESLDKANVKEKYMIEGNHDDWMNRFYEENEHNKFI